jgi:hypothetical protein
MIVVNVGRNSEAYCAAAPQLGAIRLTPIAPYTTGYRESLSC